MTILLTGAAGFIGYHVASALLAQGEQVFGIDDLNDYYDVRLKRARLARLEAQPGFRFRRMDVADPAAMQALAAEHADAEYVVHLAAQAGVRHSIENPYAYVTSNVMGQVCVLEMARRLTRLRHVVYASSSSVYGANRILPFAERDRTDQPMSTYAVTKRAAELLSTAYGHLHDMPQTGLRFFTAYGPWGRPDMSYYRFASAIMSNEAIPMYDGGVLRRDFTYIGDVVAGILGCLDKPPSGRDGPRVLNVGNHRSESVDHLVDLLERNLGRQARRVRVPRPASDVTETLADTATIAALTGFEARTSLDEGVGHFVDWFRAFPQACEFSSNIPLDRPVLPA